MQFTWSVDFDASVAEERQQRGGQACNDHRSLPVTTIGTTSVHLLVIVMRSLPLVIPIVLLAWPGLRFGCVSSTGLMDDASTFCVTAVEGFENAIAQTSHTRPTGISISISSSGWDGDKAEEVNAFEAYVCVALV
mmetsp:Transcript_24337/g.60052  ORF Transcript_24337/g.60052 Transcript_24337/m.60052 type:complete len:135 (-) Transcript_24337:765-1169(-)